MSLIRPLPTLSIEDTKSKWARRRDIPIAILAWIVLTAIILWGAGHIARTLLLLIVAALLAYALLPGIKLLQRFMPRPLAIVSIYIFVFLVIGLLIYYVVHSTIEQISSLSSFLHRWLTPPKDGSINPLEQLIQSFGFSQSQITIARDQITTRVESLANNVIPLLTSLVDFILDTVLVAVISIYFLIDGARAVHWFRRNMPRRVQAEFLLDTLQRVVGGYIRGQLLLSVLIGLLVGIGLLIFRVPYALLLGVLAFILEFIPILGTLVSGAICVLIALTQGWLIALGVLAYFVVIHILEGDIIGPRIVGKAVGLHPIVSIAALIAGTELFGIWGALLACPIAGVLQSFLIALWLHWRDRQPDQFEAIQETAAEAVNEPRVL